MEHISLDIETYSGVSLSKAGVYRYAQSEDFEILLLSYAVDDGPARVVDLAGGEGLPAEIMAALLDPRIIKWAFNANFERVCLSRWLGLPQGEYLDPSSWRCSMVWAAMLGLPLSLAAAGAVLGIAQPKLKEGRELIRAFCLPAKLADGSMGRRTACDDPQKWEAFKAYNRQDVLAEMEIRRALCAYPVPEGEWRHYTLDQRINDRGIGLDLPFIRQAIRCDELFRQEYLQKAREVTGLSNPNSAAQLKGWLHEQGVAADSLSKESVQAMLAEAQGPVAQALALRQSLSKSSVTKYRAMEAAACLDDRARGLIQFYGASRTGRYAGRLVQAHNLPRNDLDDLGGLRQLIREGDFEGVRDRHEAVPLVLSQLIRTAFIPRAGCRFFVADFSAIEARILAWLAGEGWRLQVFHEGGDLYCACAQKMFGLPVVKHGENAHLRQMGKVAELASGYGGSVGALRAMGALSMGLEEHQLKPLVNAWRGTNPHIVRYWWEVDRAVKACLLHGTATQARGIRFLCQSGTLFIVLPSGRKLAYQNPAFSRNRFGGQSVTYEGLSPARKWERQESYGPKFVENIVQAIARDILAEAMQRLEGAGYPIVMHVHDEVVIEAPASASLCDICAIMAIPPAWAEGLPLQAEGYVCDWYQKE